MEFAEWLATEVRVNKDRYDMGTPEGRKEYEDAVQFAMAAAGRKPVSERVVREPYTITCWRGFNRYSYDRDVFTKGGRLFISSEKSMEGILWFTHSLQDRSTFDKGGPEEHALSYAQAHDEGYLLTYPLRCTMAYKATEYDDGHVSEDYAEDLGPGWTKMHRRSYLLPRGWSLTWQSQMFMSFKGVLEVDASMIKRV